jgi:hypothetical protein
MPAGGRRLLFEAWLGGSGGVGRGGWVFQGGGGWRSRGGRRGLTVAVCPLGRGLASLRCLFSRGFWGSDRFLGWLGGGGAARSGGRGGIILLVPAFAQAWPARCASHKLQRPRRRRASACRTASTKTAGPRRRRLLSRAVSTVSLPQTGRGARRRRSRAPFPIPPSTTTPRVARVRVGSLKF